MEFTKIRSPSDLKRFVEASPHDSFFFTRNNMRFGGDTMRNYGTRKYSKGIIELYRRRAVKHDMADSAYFQVSDCGTFASRVYVDGNFLPQAIK